MSYFLSNAQELIPEQKNEIPNRRWSLSVESGFNLWRNQLDGTSFNLYASTLGFQVNRDYSARLSLAYLSSYQSGAYLSASSPPEYYKIDVRSYEFLLSMYRNLYSESGKSKFGIGLNLGYGNYHSPGRIESDEVNIYYFKGGLGLEYEYLFYKGISTFIQTNMNGLKMDYRSGYSYVDLGFENDLRLGLRFSF